MSKPVVAIVGRPNVGKSTLFNTLAGERISIVKDTPGVTRDRIYADVTWLNYNFTLIDTGGIEPDSGDVILSQMREQAEIAIATADVIMFITDVRQGLQDADSKVADMLRRSKKPVVLVVNKVDSFEKFMPDVYEFYNLGIGEPYPVSASSMLGLGDMLDEVVKYFPDSAMDQPEDERPKVAIIGKPNVGKSSLINKLAQEDRVIVSDIAGTTRDAIDTDIRYNGKDYVQGQGGLTGGLRSVDFNDPALGNTADAKGSVQRQRTGGDGLHVHFRPVAQTHNGDLAKGLVQLGQGGCQGFFLIGCGGRCFVHCFFRCHITVPSCRTEPARRVLFRYNPGFFPGS